jgi:acyl-CoA synthetase (AMP-forming)/AMP-acid ligase II
MLHNKDIPSLIHLLEYWANLQPDVELYRFIGDGSHVSTLTYRELAQKAQAVAFMLSDAGIKPGDRAMLIYAPGLDLITAYFGCLYAGVIAVPVYPPLNEK